MKVEQPTKGQYGQHLCREEGVGHGHTQLAAAHPVIIVLCIGPDLVCQAGVRVFSLIERLDDFNAVDVFNDDVC